MWETKRDISARGPRRETARAVTPTVGKVLEIGLALLVVTGLVSVLYGGVVPGYRTQAGGEVAERVTVGAAERIEAAIPPESQWAHVERRVPLPTTIRGETYRIVTDGGELRLEHPNSGVAAAVPLTLPDRVVSVTGTWNSGVVARGTGATAVVVVETTGSGLAVRLQDRGGGASS
jgi:hypothetical protein